MVGTLEQQGYRDHRVASLRILSQRGLRTTGRYTDGVTVIETRGDTSLGEPVDRYLVLDDERFGVKVEYPPRGERAGILPSPEGVIIALPDGNLIYSFLKFDRGEPFLIVCTTQGHTRQELKIPYAIGYAQESGQGRRYRPTISTHLPPHVIIMGPKAEDAVIAEEGMDSPLVHLSEGPEGWKKLELQDGAFYLRESLTQREIRELWEMSLTPYGWFGHLTDNPVVAFRNW